MSEKVTSAFPPLPPVGKWLPAVALAWLVPGGGHFLLKRPYRGAILCGSTVMLFLAGIMMRGYMFQPMNDDLMTSIIYTGGSIADACTGVLFVLAKMLGYEAPDVAGHTVAYGTRFLVIAGLFNILAMVDAFEIAIGRKE
jgi:hypothetical protein